MWFITTTPRICQEAINNCLRHANAEEVYLQIMQYPNLVLLTVEDNGRGVDLDKIQGNSFGLQSMQTRTKALNGEWYFDSQPGKGTYITIRFPIHSKNK